MSVGKHASAHRLLADGMDHSDPITAADVWRRRAQALVELADAHEAASATRRRLS